MSSKRILGLDIVRTIAVFFVISVHFFLNNGFYGLDITGFNFIIPITFRWLFYICVPLFLLITGYLKRKKKLSKDYYKGIIPILTSYLFISICCIFFRYFYLHDGTGIKSLIMGIFNFTTDGYSWYIKMYIGLFLLIPFLNIMYSGLRTKKNKQALIITLGGMVSLSPLINHLKFQGIYTTVIPNYWDNIYPLLYYFIGCYLNEYKLKTNKKKLITIGITLLLFEGIGTYFYYKGIPMGWEFLEGYNSLPTAIVASIIFLLVYDINIENHVVRKIFTNISKNSLDIYLFSYIVDNIVYSLFKLPLSINSYLKYYLLIVPTVFFCSYILSIIKDGIFNIIKFIKEKLKRKKH